jgi:hypothetical protein
MPYRERFELPKRLPVRLSETHRPTCLILHGVRLCIGSKLWTGMFGFPNKPTASADYKTTGVGSVTVCSGAEAAW